MPPPAIDLSTFVATIAAHDRLRHVALPGFVRRRLHAHLGQACPLCAQVHITRVEPKATWLTLASRPPRNRFVMLRL